MKHRLERVRELVKRELGSVMIRELSFTSPLVSVQDVDLTPDLKHAHVFVSVMGSEEQKKEALLTLSKNRGLLQSELSKRIVLKNTPHLHFRLDESIERGVRVIHLMEQIDPPAEEPQ